MALTVCRECKTEVSSNAKVCPRCGIDKPAKTVRTAQQRGQLWLAVIAVVILYFIIRAVMPAGGSSSASSSSSAKNTTSTFAAPSPFTLARDGYVIKGTSHSFSSGEIDIDLAVIFRKRPTLENAYSILSSEVAGYVRQIGGPPKVEVIAYAYVGNPENDRNSWEQIKDTGHSYYVTARFDARTNSIMKGRLDAGEPIVHNVLSGPQADTTAAVAKADDDERAKQHEKNKLTTAAAGAQQLLKHLRDPESLKIESLLITDKDGMACIEYRAKNGFGGMNRGQAVFIVLALITESDKEFPTAWNQWCANKTGTEEGPYVSRLIEQGIIK
jgi:hypothetical protein